ncbi:hypothetical protein L596_007499 [Steinernema carpocapsae]|uniref:Cysteine/serine-rich nuclear protein N-terminal domain-containing protein n=1 Tax=Steinernema carpocapsae TaxID=34508 RepID=A0A4U5P9W5_STECR|nr:hypothetical protein L596_007499 [Steinernema carpocapsae]
MADVADVQEIVASMVDTVAALNLIETSLPTLISSIEAESNPGSPLKEVAVKVAKPRNPRKRNVVPRAEPERVSKRLKSNRKKVQFDGVKVYFFERTQGFSVVPSVGGTSLGMGDLHHSDMHFTLAEHRRFSQQENEIKTMERMLAMKSEIQKRLERSKPGSSEIAQSGPSSSQVENTEMKTESDEELEALGAQYGIDESDMDEDEVIFPDDEYCFQPWGSTARKLIFKSQGIPIDESDKLENKTIRASRATCGCSCRDGKCNPDTCQCAIDGIKCQVDRQGFPCSCAVDCENPLGRVVFNERRVRSHFNQTMMRMRAARSRNAVAHVSSPLHIRFDDSHTTTSYLSTPPPAIYQNALGNEQNEMATPERPPRKFPVTPTYKRPRLDVQNKAGALLNCNNNNVHSSTEAVDEEGDTFPLASSLLGPSKTASG